MIIKKINIKSLTVLAAFIIGGYFIGSNAQTLETSAKDSLQAVNSNNIDTLKNASSAKSSITAPIFYKADSIELSASNKITYLRGHSEIKYQKMVLTAEKITIDWDTSLITAEAVTDTVDSLGYPVYKGIPRFEEKGTEPMEGLKLTYNFETRRGRVWEGTTEMDPGYYRGVNIKKIGDQTMLIKEGYFTSCDHKNHPHYYFRSKKMWMRIGKKLVAKPIVLYIADIPVMYFPLVYMSLQRNRRSGILIPKYGNSDAYGRYLKDFGFYWAMNDYMDMTLRSTYYDKGIWVFSGNYRYLKRYSLGGSISADYSPKDIITGERRERYKIAFRHKQEIKLIDIPGLRFLAPLSINASGQFQSDKTFNKQYYSSIDDRLNQEMVTSVSLRKKIPGLNSSLNISFYRNENLQTGNISRKFPQASFSLPSRQLGGKGKHWYGNITYNYRTKLTENYTKTYDSDSTFTENSRKGWQHSLSVRATQKILKYISVAPNANFNELWVNEYRDYQWIDSLNSAIYEKKRGFKARHTFDLGISAKTTLYGLFELPFGPMKLIRHKMEPSVTYTWVPNFSEEKYGYTEHFIDSTGLEKSYDIFADNPYGGTPSSESKRFRFSLNNLFQGKIINKDGNEKKLDLLKWNLSTSYNMLADSLQWSDLSSRINTTIKWFKLTGSMGHSFYERRSTGSGNRDQFYGENHNFPLRFLYAKFNTGFTLSSSLFSKKKPEKQNSENKEEDGLSEFSSSTKLKDSYQRNEYSLDKLRKSNTSWKSSFSLSYTYDKRDINNIKKIFGINSNITLQLTKNWKILYRANMDIFEKKLQYQEVTVFRDLHCWEMYLRWQPQRPGSSYSFYEFRINVKASALKDLKLTKHGYGSTVY